MTIISELESSGETFRLLTEISEENKGQLAIISNSELFFPRKNLNGLQLINEKIIFYEKTESSGIIKRVRSEFFADINFPKPRLVIIGAVHIAISLVKMAQICGFTTIIIDPRKAFA